MPKLTISDVTHVASLAKLTLTPDEISKYQKQLSGVVDYIGELSEVDTEGIEPTSQTAGLTNVARADEIKQESILTKDEALSGTEEYNGYFKVPGILKKDE